MNQQVKSQTEPPRWRFVAFVFAYAIAIKVLPYVLYRMGMDVEQNFTIYPWNFSPIFAVAIFGGAMYKSKTNALWAPLAAMLAGDIGIWAVTGKFDWAFYSGQWVIYAAFAICAAIGFLLREKRTWGRVAITGAASCLTFFLITNFATWVGSTIYPQNLAGLTACYVAGLPFLKNSLVATAIFGGLLFSPAAIQQSETAIEEQTDFATAPQLN